MNKATCNQSENCNTYVTVRCNKCGAECGFFPMRVVRLHGCKCGNDDYGNPKNWLGGHFGSFTLVKQENWALDQFTLIGGSK